MRRNRIPGPINRRRTWAPDYGDGSEGAVTPANGATLAASYNATDCTILAGRTVYIPANTVVVVRCTGTFKIESTGIINGDGRGYSGGAAVTNGQSIQGITGNEGGGYGAGASGSAAGGGGGGGAVSAGLDGLLTGTFGNWCQGPGGGSGGVGVNSATSGAGGTGGGTLIVVARRIVIEAADALTLDGANGTNASTVDAPAGGGGGAGGGQAILAGDSIELPSSGTAITATAGSGGTGAGGGSAGAAGTAGRVYYCYTGSLSPTDATSRSNPSATAVSLVPTMDLG